MEAITGGANFKCSLVRWSWPAAFSEGKEEMALATSSSVIRSGSEWEVASSSREISELQSGDMVESWLMMLVASLGAWGEVWERID